MEYNTARNYLSMREYGRHIQKMVEHLLAIPDKEERQQQTKSVIELMGFLNPHLKNVEDFRHMLWDHLFFISDFKLDVDSPYPIPKKETYKAKPDPMGYPKRHPKYSHLGKNLEIIIDKALAEDNPEKKAGFANAIAYYMKLSYSNWHKELVHDDAIRGELTAMTKGQLNFDNTPYIKHRPPAFESDDYRPAAKRVYSGRTNNGNGNVNRQQSNGNRADGNRADGNRADGNRSDSNRNFNTSSPRNSNNRNNSNGGNGRNNNNNNRNPNYKKRFL